jgi:four helix bundle protein
MKRLPAKKLSRFNRLAKSTSDLVLAMYRQSASFPKDELCGLTSQARSAAVSVPANIAEGFKKKTRPDKARYLNIAQGSLEEVRYYLILFKDLDYGDTSGIMNQLEEVSKLLEGYLSSILNSDS